MRKLTLFVLFVAVMLITIIWQAPLSFALRRANLDQYGLQWERARGSIWNGQVTGLSLGQQAIGNAVLKLHASDLLKGHIGYDVVWSGRPGRGTGTLSFGNSGFHMTNLRGELDLAAISGLSARLRQIGGLARVRVDEIIIQNNRCEKANGSVSTDFLSRVSASYGSEWPNLEGTITCDQDMLTIPLEARSSLGETFHVQALIGLTEASSIAARVSNAGPELETALAMLGFWLDNGDYIYRREAVLAKGIQ